MTVQLSLFDYETPLPVLPPLPQVIRYYDDFARVYRSLNGLDEDRWTIFADGSSVSWNFARFPEPVRSVARRVFSEALVATSTTTAITYWRNLSSIDEDLMTEGVVKALCVSPVDFRPWWIFEARDRLTREQAVPFRHLLLWFCRWEVGYWRQADRDLIRALPGHSFIKYGSVSDRSAILPNEAKSKIVTYLDEVSASATTRQCSRERARDAAILAIAYQHGLRTRQIAMLDHSDVRILDRETVHIRPTLIKQRQEKVGRVVNRKIQPAWASLFAYWSEGRSGELNKFFDMTPGEVGQIILSLSQSITNKAYSARELRHTGAQRLVDSGASREAVSEYLGHTDTTSANIYFDSSPAQNTLVNAALGESPIYRSVAAAARGKLITVENLAERPADHQVIGMPHGVPISGIGACVAGQSLCTRNPVLACYTCHKFLPVSDRNTHQQVLSDLKDVVRGFDQPARIDRVSPAMLQLRSTLEAIDAVLTEIGDANK